MSNEDRTAPIRTLLGDLDGQIRPRPTKCGGAIVPVTMGTYQATARLFDVDFTTDIDDLPKDGSRFDARVACTSDVRATEVGLVGVPVQYATCERCANIEKRLRQALAAKLANQEQPR